MTRALIFILALVAALIPTTDVRAMSCSVTSLTGVAFGVYDAFGSSPVYSAGSITYECSEVGASDTIAIDLSTGSSSTYDPRRLIHGIHYLAYNLYLDAAHSIVWGNGAGGTARYQQIEPAEATAVAVPVYGQIPALQNAAAGTYGDTIVATVIF